VVSRDTVYDLASVTKVIPTNSIILSLIERGLLSFDDQAIKFLPELTCPNSDQILIRHLLTFTVVFDLPHRLSSYASEGKSSIVKAIYDAPLKYPPGEKYVYSNMPSFLLGMIAEKISGKPLDAIAADMFFRPLRMTRTTFHPEDLKHISVAPTEIDAQGEVVGVVHDESARALYKEGVIAGHAGLFSTTGDLLRFGRMLLQDGESGGHRFFKPETIQEMGKEVVNNGESGVSLGWATNHLGHTNPRTSSYVFGKDGFTGTTILLDTHKKRCLVLLSNRTYPKRPETREDISVVRGKLANTLST
jgi:CubicO group peptidase (beta-lactamase class C family)